MRNYILVDGHPVLEPDVLKWCLWFASADRVLARDQVGPVLVWTVFLALDYARQDGPPFLWETTVSHGDDGFEQERYTSREDALTGHATWVQRARLGALEP